MGKHDDALLIPETNPIPVIPCVAQLVGINAAVILQQVHYWCEKNRKCGANFHDGYYWTYGTYEEWAAQFSWMGESTVRSNFSKLQKSGLLITANHNRHKYDRTKWYRVDKENLMRVLVEQKLYLPSAKNEQSHSLENGAPIPETYKETNTESKMYNGRFSDEQATSEFSFDQEFLSFIDWYKEYYHWTYGKHHPNLKAAQLWRVHEELRNWCIENDCNPEEHLQPMAKSFFAKVEDSDHNINHFATRGILDIRFFDCGLYQGDCEFD